MTRGSHVRVYGSGLLSVVLALLGAGCGGARRPPVERMWPCMGTFATVTAPADQAARLDSYAAAAEDTTAELNRRLSIFNPESEISRLNAAAGREPVALGPHGRRLLELSLLYSERTQGAFDATILPVIRLWGFNGGTPPEQPLAASAVRAALALTGARQVELGATNAYLRTPGCQVDFGGIAKGYAVDEVYARLLRDGATDVMVNLGGNIRCGGSSQGAGASGRPGPPWRIGVRNPFNREQIVGSIDLTGGSAVATSGNYERFVMIGGRRYAHIIDPRSGYPVQGMAGVTVLTATAVEADALSTALFVLGPEAARPVLARLPHVAALFVPDEQPLRILVTRGMRAAFKPARPFAAAVEWLDY